MSHNYAKNDGHDRRLVLGIDASRANSLARTGTEWYAYHVIQGLKKLIPADVRVVLYSKEPLRDGLEVLPENWRSRVLPWRGPFWTQLRLSWEMANWPPLVLFVPAHTLPMITPWRVVTTLHDLGFLSVPEAYSPNERLYHRLSTRVALRWARQLLTVSEFSRQEIIRRYGVRPERVTVTPLACDREAFRSDLATTNTADMRDVWEKYGLKQPYFLFTGRLEYKKNLRLLLDAFGKYVRDGGRAQLVLAGKRGLGADEVIAGLTMDIRRRVVETGYVSARALPLLYAGAAAYVFPSRYEGFGIPLLEAFACGVPVVATRVASIPEVAGEAALYVKPDDVAGLADAMARIISDEVLRERLVQAGRARVDQFSWSKTVEMTWQVLEGVLRR